MKNPIPLSVLVCPPVSGLEWTAHVTVTLPGYGSGIACGDSAGQAISDALLIALATRSEPDQGAALAS
jgi:hypothetical protein